MKHPIPNAALDDRLGFIGTSGSGKTYNAGGAVERLLAAESRVVIVDPLGVWWGLRLLADGKSQSPHDVAIFGGPHGDLPLTEHAGALIGETAATMAESCIVDLSELGTKSAERAFMTAFLETIYRKANKEPFHLVVDEADLFAPQNPPKGDETLLNRMEQIVRRGRVKGFIPWLISQRPAILNKNVLSQVDGLIAFKLTATQDRDALDGWIEGQADKARGKEIKAALPAMQIGEGIVWLPGRGVLETVKFPPKATYDSSRTPKRGEKIKRTASLKPLDLGALKDRLAVVEKETKANDPRALKAEVAKLTRELALKPTAGQIDTKAIEAAAYARGAEDGYKRAIVGVKAEFKVVMDLLPAMAKVESAAAQIKHWANEPPPKMQPTYAARPTTIIHRPVTAPRPVASGGGNGERLPPGEQAVLIAAAQFGVVEKEQLTILTGYKRSSRDAYIQRLREKQFIEVSGSSVTPTQAGIDALPADYEPLPTGQDLQAYWLARLPEGERRVLEVLIAAYPKAVDKADIDAATGYQRSSRDAYLQRMKAKRLWEKSGGGVVAAEALFG